MEYTDFMHSTLGKTGLKVNRIGLSASYRPEKKQFIKPLMKD